MKFSRHYNTQTPKILLVTILQNIILDKTAPPARSYSYGFLDSYK